MSSHVGPGPAPEAGSIPEDGAPRPQPVQEVRLDPPLLETPAVAPAPRGDRLLRDQLARIEEKTARLEEKFARTETMVGRFDAKVDAFASHAGELARAEELRSVQAELAAVRRRVGGVPGYGGLFFSIVVTALLTAALVYAVQRYAAGTLPGLAPASPAIGTLPPSTPAPAPGGPAR